MENKILALLSSFILKPRLRVFTQSDVAKDLLLFLLYKRGQYLEKKPGN